LCQQANYRHNANHREGKNDLGKPVDENWLAIYAYKCLGRTLVRYSMDTRKTVSDPTSAPFMGAEK
jgi:hypothetical protein